jgi:hypothetical protein
MTALAQKKDLVLQRELAFANAVGSSVLEKPKVSFWMVLIPILFLYFIYRMQTYKSGRIKFDEEFMTNRRRAMDAAMVAVETKGRPDIDGLARSSSLPAALHGPYAAWMEALVGHYMELLAAEGHSFESLVRSAYHDRNGYLLALNRLTTVERAFYQALKPHLDAAEGAADIIATIETRSQQLRRELAEQVFR